MRSSHIRSHRLSLLLLSTAVQLLACGEDERQTEVPTLLAADDGDHYGKTYDEWAAAWVRYVSSYAPPKCADPIQDETGQFCADDQDPASPVFFLTGRFGGTVVRQCTVPAGKALFFPLVNTWGDNAGVPEDMLLTQEEISGYLEEGLGALDPALLFLSVDGVAYDDLDSGLVPDAPYTIELDEAGNNYTCQGVEGVFGRFDGRVAGYWALLEPLAPGVHTLRFGSERGDDAVFSDSFELDVTYELTVE